MKFIFAVLVVAMNLISLLTVAQPLSGENVVISDPVDHDLYVAGGTVTLNAPVKGDVILVGGTIVVNDSVSQDILATGGNIFLHGFVGDDVRCFGGKVQIDGSVLGDFVVTGGEAMILRGGVVGGDMLSAGGDVKMDGLVKGNLRNFSGVFELNGTVMRELRCKGEKLVLNGDVGGDAVLAAEEIEIGQGAILRRDLTYWNEAGSLDLGKSMQGGKANYDPTLEIKRGRWHYLGFASVVMLVWYLATAFVMISLIQYLFSRTLKKAAITIREASLKALGVGFLFLIGVPIAIVIFFVTIIGIPVGVLTLFGYLTLLFLASIIVALLTSNWISSTYYQSAWENWRIVITAFGLFILLKLASLTPFVGPLVTLLLICMGFGGILLNVKFKKPGVVPGVS